MSYLSHVAHQAKPWDKQHVVGKTSYSMSVVALSFALYTSMLHNLLLLFVGVRSARVDSCRGLQHLADAETCFAVSRRFWIKISTVGCMFQ